MEAPTAALDRPPPLAAERLRRRCDPAELGFATTAEVEEPVDIVDQSRAIDAVRFGIAIKRAGFNLFVLGSPGSGRHAAVRRLLLARAADEPVPGDICYVNNFTEPDRPCLLQLPPGRGAKFKADMEQFVAELATAITAAFESDEYRTRIEAIHEEFKEKEEKALRELGQASAETGVALLRTPHGFAFSPIKDEETMKTEDFEALPDEEKKRYAKLMEEHGEQLARLMHQIPRWRRKMEVRIKDIGRETMQFAVGHLIEDLKGHYTDLANVGSFLDAVMDDVIESAEELREAPKTEDGIATITGMLPLGRYQVNLFVDNGTTGAAPVVVEDNPIYPNLVGRVDHVAHMGTLVTNFTMIVAGALHRAQGGYLMLDADKLLRHPYSWEGLKRALKSGQVRIESLGQIYGLTSTESLTPEPMPLSVKVVLV
ncbi:MAG TPA: ATP-binding protein, partial [Rhodocyclaceae bacterium]